MQPSSTDGSTDEADRRVLDATVRRLDDFVVCVDGDWRVIYVNDAVARARGVAAETLVGQDAWALWPAATGTQLEVACREAMASRASVEVEAHLPDAGRWLEARVVPAGGRALLVSAVDVTARHTADAERAARVRALEDDRVTAQATARWAQFLTRTTEALAAAVGVEETLARVGELLVPTLADVCIVYLLEDAPPPADARPAAAHGAGAPPRQLLRRAAIVAANPRVGDALEALDAATLWADGPTPVALATRRHEPILIPEVRAETIARAVESPAQDELLRRVQLRSALAVPLVAAGRSLGALLLGLTGGEQRFTPRDSDVALEFARRVALALDHARLYDAARAAQRNAESANRAKSDFLATMSHELRTPLSAVIGYAALLGDAVLGPLSPEQQTPVRRISASARHLLALIEDILAYAKVEVGPETGLRGEPVDVAELAREVAEMLEPSALQQALAFELDVPPRPLMVTTDARRVRQILLNLLGNAVRYTEEGGIRLHVASDGGGAVRIVVADTGVGIAPEHLEQVFEPFWQVDQSHVRRHGGSGLGLAVSRRLARTLGGDLTVESTPGEGSTFTLVLPPTLPGAVAA